MAVLKGDAEDSRLLAGQLGMEAERARQAEVEAQQQAAFLEEALESPTARRKPTSPASPATVTAQTSTELHLQPAGTDLLPAYALLNR